MSQPDPKPAARVKDPLLLNRLHYRQRECELADFLHPGDPYAPRVHRLSAHHVHKHPRDDVEGNLTMLCGDGTTGCHGRIEHADLEARGALVRMIRYSRPDVFLYLTHKLGGSIQADDYLRRLANGKGT